MAVTVPCAQRRDRPSRGAGRCRGSGGHTGRHRYLVPVETTQFWQLGDKHGGHDRSHSANQLHNPNL